MHNLEIGILIEPFFTCFFVLTSDNIGAVTNWAVFFSSNDDQFLFFDHIYKYWSSLWDLFWLDSWLFLLGILMKWLTNVGGILQTLHGLCYYNVITIWILDWSSTKVIHIYILWEAFFIYLCFIPSKKTCSYLYDYTRIPEKWCIGGNLLFWMLDWRISFIFGSQPLGILSCWNNENSIKINHVVWMIYCWYQSCIHKSLGSVIIRNLRKSPLKQNGNLKSFITCLFCQTAYNVLHMIHTFQGAKSFCIESSVSA